MNLFDRTLSQMLGGVQKKRSVGFSGRPFLDFMNSTAGQRVNTETSLKISSFWCGVKAISDSIAMLPKHVIVKDGSKQVRAKGHKVDTLIHSLPNTMMTAYSFWAAFTVSALIKGNGYAYISRDGAGKIKALELWDNADVTHLVNEGELYYKHVDFKLPFHASEVFHVPNFSTNGIDGRGVIRYAADNMGVSLAADEFATTTYHNKGLSFGILETEKSLNDQGKKNLKKIYGQSMDTGNPHRLAVFDEGMKYKRIALSPAESDFIAAKAQGVEDIARWLNIPLHKLHAKGEGGYNFLVQMSIEYLQSCVLPMGQKIKEEIERKLLTTKEKAEGHSCFMNYRKLLEVDPAARTAYYKDMVYIKSMSPNEVRVLEDMNPYDGGNEMLQMSNLQTSEQIKKQMEG